MFFTQEDYRKIYDWIKSHSIKDSEFIDSKPIDGRETITVVQQGHNVKFVLQDFLEQLALLNIPDFVNVTERYNLKYTSLFEATKAIPYKSRKIGQVITLLDEDGNWKIYQFRGEKVNQWNTLSLWTDILQDIIDIGSIIPDNEDLVAVKREDKTVVKFKDKVYNPNAFSGKGRVYLRKNITQVQDHITLDPKTVNLLTQSMFGKENTIYIIQYDYDLNGQNITIPEGCVLNFQGGSLSNGGIIGNNTQLCCADSITLFSNIIIDGSFTNTNFNMSWVGIIPNTNVDYTDIVNTTINNLLKHNIRHFYFPTGTYIVSINLSLKETLDEDALALTALTGGAKRAFYASIYGDGYNTILTQGKGTSVLKLSGVVDENSSYNKGGNLLLRMFDFHDITIDGKRTNKNGIELFNIQEFHLRNVYITCVYGTAIECNNLMDSVFSNLFILDCAINDKDVNGNVPYCIKTNNILRDRTNAIKISDLHIESSPRAFNFNSPHHIFISRCKYEKWIHNDSDDYTPLLFNSCIDVVFNDFHFIASDLTRTENQTFHPLIKNVPNNVEGFGVQFNYMSLSGTGQTFKVASDISWTCFTNCLFQCVYEIKDINVYYIDIKTYNKFENCVFYGYKNNFINVIGNNNVIKGCRFTSYSNDANRYFIKIGTSLVLQELDANFISKTSFNSYTNFIYQNSKIYDDNHILYWNNINKYNINNKTQYIISGELSDTINIGYAENIMFQSITNESSVINIKYILGHININSIFSFRNNTGKTIILSIGGNIHKNVVIRSLDTVILKYDYSRHVFTTVAFPYAIASLDINDVSNSYPINSIACINDSICVKRANGWVKSQGEPIDVLYQGTTANRPTGDGLKIGYLYFNKDTNRFDIWNGTSWNNYNGYDANLRTRGTTDNRPNIEINTNVGFEYFDITIKKPIWWSGTNWIDATGATI